MRDSIRLTLVLCLLITVLVTPALSGPDFQPTYLVLLLNTLFIGVGGAAVAWLSARSYQSGAPMSLLMLGSGSLMMATTAVIAGYVVADTNANVTIFNLGIALAAGLQLGNAVLLTLGHSGSRYSGPRLDYLLASYLAAVALTLVVSILAISNVLPVFFIDDSGGTLIRAAVIGAAVLMFALSALLIERRYQDVLSPVLGWYSIGLALFAIGMFGVAMENSIGDPAGWAGKAAQYAGSVGLIMAVVSAYRQPDAVKGWTRAFTLDRTQFRQIFDSMGEGFAYQRIVVDRQGRPVDYVFVDMNPAFTHLTGIGRDAIGKKATEIMPGMENDPADWIGTFGRVAQTQQPVKFEKFSANLGKWFSVAAYCPMEGHFATIFEDVTARKTMEQEVARSNAELQNFAYVSSHDMQEPLRMVASYLGLLERRYGDKLDDRAKEYIAYAVDGARRMKDLIDDLLSYSRVQSNPRLFAPVNMNEACAKAIDNLGDSMERNGAEIRIEELPTLQADEVQMVQLMQNLLGNAIKFHGNQAPFVVVRAREGTEEWTLSVQDNGIGIAPEHQRKVFEMFSRLHARDEYEGTGIGLALAKSIVERHGGRIWVESDGAHGSTFSFTIPKKGR